LAFYHVKELEYNARVSGPDPRFASLLLEQFGGANGELSAAMQYFVQSFGARQPHPDKYDLLMDIATEELSHLEIVGATITMLLEGLNGELKNAFEKSDLARLLKGKSEKEQIIQEAGAYRQFLVLSGGGPTLTNSNGVPWSAGYIHANGDLTVDLRSDIGAEARAKIVYEYLMQFTDDACVHDTLRFLMTREIAHQQMFTAALESIQPNFPPGTLHGDPHFTHVYTNFSNGASARGPWNQEQGPWGKGQSWDYVEDPLQGITQTDGLIHLPIRGTNETMQEAEQYSKQLGKKRKDEVDRMVPSGYNQWSAYPQKSLESPVSPPMRGATGSNQESGSSPGNEGRAGEGSGNAGNPGA
jgi:Mn-containing catalase